MSSITLHTEICPNCGKEQKVERYDSINNYEREVSLTDGSYHK